MRDFRFDLDVVLKNCDRFGVAVDDTAGKVTINGNEFDVVEVINSLLEIK